MRGCPEPHTHRINPDQYVHSVSQKETYVHGGNQNCRCVGLARTVSVSQKETYVHGGNQNCRCVGLSQKETYVHGGNQNHTCIGSIKTIHPQGWPEIYVHRVGPDRMCRVGQNHIFIRIYGVHTVF